jgi:hypothetical protein
VKQDGIGFEAATQMLQAKFMDQQTLISRIRMLVSAACNSKSSLKQDRLYVIGQLIKAVLDMAVAFNLEKTSKKIFAVYSNAYRKLQGTALGASVPTISERCDICDTEIQLQSLTEAYCAEGHQFGKKYALLTLILANWIANKARCGLTFLSIQEPGVCKFCGICGTSFLKDSYAFQSDGGMIESTERSHNVESLIDTVGNADPNRSQSLEFSLSQMLYAAFDVCIYCGGRYVD